MLESSHRGLRYQFGSLCTGTQGDLSPASRYYCSIAETSWHTHLYLETLQGNTGQPKSCPCIKFICYSFWVCGRFAFVCGRFALICARFALCFLDVFWCQSQISSSECHFPPMICIYFHEFASSAPSSFHTFVQVLVINLGPGPNQVHISMKCHANDSYFGHISSYVGR